MTPKAQATKVKETNGIALSKIHFCTTKKTNRREWVSGKNITLI